MSSTRPRDMIRLADPGLLSDLRWGWEKMRWVVELLFDDLFNWNSWMWENRREKPALLLSWGSNPFPYAPDGSSVSKSGCAKSHLLTPTAQQRDAHLKLASSSSLPFGPKVWWWLRPAREWTRQRSGHGRHRL